MKKYIIIGGALYVVFVAGLFIGVDDRNSLRKEVEKQHSLNTELINSLAEKEQNIKTYQTKIGELERKISENESKQIQTPQKIEQPTVVKAIKKTNSKEYTIVKPNTTQRENRLPCIEYCGNEGTKCIEKISQIGRAHV